MSNNATFPPLANNATDFNDPASPPEWKPIVPNGSAPLTDVMLRRAAMYGYTFTKKWNYYNEQGQLLFHIVRYERASAGTTPAEKMIFPFTWCEGPNGHRQWRRQAWPSARPPFNLRALIAGPEKPVIVVEGEKAADAGSRLFPEYIVLASSGGSNAAGKTDWAPLKGRAVTIWPDNDDAGRKYADEVAQLATVAGAASVRIVNVPSNFPPKWDLADAVPPGTDLTQLLTSAERPVSSVETPTPLLPESPPEEPFPVAALRPLRAVVEAVQGMTLAPMAIPAASALAVASLAVQGFRDVETLGGKRPLSLYVLTIAQSGERKSSCDEVIMEALRQFEKNEDAVRRDAVSAWSSNQALWKSDKEQLLAEAKKKTENRKSIEDGLSKLGAEPAPPPLAERTVTEPTYEGLTRKFSEGMPTLGIFSDEGGQFLGGYAMSPDNRQKTLTALNDLWQGNTIRRTRSGEGTSTLYGRRLAVHLMVQPEVARNFMADPLSTGTGFLPRFLICEPPSTVGTRFQAKIKRNNAPLSDFGARLKAILETALPMDNATRELMPTLLPLSDAARALLSGYADDVELKQAPSGAYSSIQGYASKSAEQAARIAGVLTAWGDLRAKEVTAATMSDAISLAKFYLSDALKLTNSANVSREVANAEALRKWLLESCERQLVTPRDILQYGPSRLREGPKVQTAIALLVKHGWLVRLPDGAVVDGAPRKEAYRIVKGAQ
ncbi:hypothetical protein QO002_001831 [Pararhizobium capsulatum DSM 1112]|uniref:DUF6371 domain-containing protein n=1 Tax=Pararhizobium capsulatum DSM 1112 TaxID=1121113 RepID=A0ABU0BN56_9HYPH|nr:DUF3987 domain-containing protein [Pararhizobium capsulatum]MDQ0319693.1 hypothetical protein [Pararhizobium capsulatum DSM 1112]